MKLWFALRRWLRAHRLWPRRRFHLRARCYTHGTRVWSSTRANRAKSGRIYCTPACKDAAALRPPQATPKRPTPEPTAPRCPRPDKRRFDTEAECRAAFATLLKADNTLDVYRCRCSKWHAGHGVDPLLRIEARLPEHVVLSLAALVEPTVPPAQTLRNRAERVRQAAGATTNPLEAAACRGKAKGYLEAAQLLEAIERRLTQPSP